MEEVFWHRAGRSGHPPVLLRFARINGRLECVRVEIGWDLHPLRSVQPSPIRTGVRPVTPTNIRVPLGELIQSGRQGWERHLKTHAEESDPTWETARRIREKMASEGERLQSEKPRARGRPVHWNEVRLAAEVATPYAEALEKGQPAIKAVVDETGLSPARAKDLVTKARQSGLLVAPRDSTNERLSAKAKRLMDKEEKR